MVILLLVSFTEPGKKDSLKVSFAKPGIMFFDEIVKLCFLGKKPAQAWGEHSSNMLCVKHFFKKIDPSGVKMNVSYWGKELPDWLFCLSSNLRHINLNYIASRVLYTHANCVGLCVCVCLSLAFFRLANTDSINISASRWNKVDTVLDSHNRLTHLDTKARTLR